MELFGKRGLLLKGGTDMNRRNLNFLLIMICIFAASACGVEKEETPSLGDAPNVEGPWRIILLPYSSTCLDSLEPRGFVVHNPIDIPYVSQDGYNFYSSFLLDGEEVILSGVAANSYLAGLLEKPGVFMESFAGMLNASIIAGTFNGQELPQGCEERGAFLAAVGAVETPSVAGEWTITLRGTAESCEDIADEGTFEKVIASVMVNEAAEGVVGGFFEDPPGVQNAVGGLALSNTFTGAITDTSVPPLRVAVLNGTIYPASRLIEGELTGQLVFSRGLCRIAGGSFSISY